MDVQYILSISTAKYSLFIERYFVELLSKIACSPFIDCIFTSSKLILEFYILKKLNLILICIEPAMNLLSSCEFITSE